MNGGESTDCEKVQFSYMIVDKLKAECKERELRVGGTKTELIEQLNKYVSRQTPTSPTVDLPKIDEFDDMVYTEEDLAMAYCSVS